MIHENYACPILLAFKDLKISEIVTLLNRFKLVEPYDENSNQGLFLNTL